MHVLSGNLTWQMVLIKKGKKNALMDRKRTNATLLKRTHKSSSNLIKNHIIAHRFLKHLKYILAMMMMMWQYFNKGLRVKICKKIACH
jgi:hypothetical protein